MSTAMISLAPAIRAPWIADRPMPPQPITATGSPGATRGSANTAPKPVVTAHPMSAALSSGISVFDLHERLFVDQHLLGERRQVHELVHRLTRCGSVRGGWPG